MSGHVSWNGRDACQRAMDKRITGIIRWLERCRSSYESGAIESALMDAECARADLEDLRTNVWAGVRANYVPRRSRFLSVLCAFFLLPIVMVMATPGHIASRVPVLPLDELEPITVSESASVLTIPAAIQPMQDLEAAVASKTTPIPAVDVSESTLANVTPVNASVAPKSTKMATSIAKKSRNTSAATTTRVDGKISRGQIKQEPKASTSPAREIPTYDTMLALFQTGQRALKGN